jgi:hypothetical protein
MYKVLYEEWFRNKDGDWDYRVKEKLCTCQTEAEFLVSKLKNDELYRYENIMIAVLEHLPTAST